MTIITLSYKCFDYIYSKLDEIISLNSISDRIHNTLVILFVNIIDWTEI